MIKFSLPKLLGVLLFGFLFIQFLGPGKTNPPVEASQTLTVQLEVPLQVRNILARACQNCHSYETQWPWYSNVAPVSWFVIDHVNHARREMDLSNWAQYDRNKMIHKLEELCELVEQGEMPLPPYLWMHDEAHLAAEDVKILCEWSTTERERLVGIATISPEE